VSEATYEVLQSFALNLFTYYEVHAISQVEVHYFTQNETKEMSMCTISSYFFDA